MPKCTDCEHEGKYFTLETPFPVDLVVREKLGMPGEGGVTLVGFAEDARKRGFTQDDLVTKGMRCQAPGGGPTQDPIVLVQAIGDQPCSYFSPRRTRKTMASSGEREKRPTPKSRPGARTEEGDAAERTAQKSSVHMSKQFYLGALIGGWIASLIFTSLALTVDDGFTAISIVVGLVFLAVYLRFWYVAWSAIQDGHARTTPGKAIGFLFIPLFNFYWIFQLIWGFAKDFNGYVLRHGPDTDVLPEGMFLAIPILGLASLIPVVGTFTSLIGAVLLFIGIAQICDGVNAFGRAGPTGAGA